MTLQKYQFELRDCSHISCHKVTGISLAKKYKIFKFTVAMSRWLHLPPVATLVTDNGARLVTIVIGDGHITRTIVATGERHHLPIAREIGPACQRPSVPMESSKFSPTSLPKMRTNEVKNSYCPQPTRVDHGREEFVNSVQFDGSWQNLILYSQML
jgi:hypothetical protein